MRLEPRIMDYRGATRSEGADNPVRVSPVVICEGEERGEHLGACKEDDHVRVVGFCQRIPPLESIALFAGRNGCTAAVIFVGQPGGLLVAFTLDDARFPA